MGNSQSKLPNRNDESTTDFDGADAGKTPHYMLRWVSTTGEKGPWSETASATVGRRRAPEK